MIIRTRCVCDTKALFSYGCSCGGAAVELAAERAARDGVDKVVVRTPASPVAAPTLSVDWTSDGAYKAAGGGHKGHTYRLEGSMIYVRMAGVWSQFPARDIERRLPAFIEEAKQHQRGG